MVSAGQLEHAEVMTLRFVLVAEEQVAGDVAGRQQAVELVGGGVLAAVDLAGRAWVRTVCHDSRFAPGAARSGETRGQSPIAIATIAGARKATEPSESLNCPNASGV